MRQPRRCAWRTSLSPCSCVLQPSGSSGPRKLVAFSASLPPPPPPLLPLAAPAPHSSHSRRPVAASIATTRTRLPLCSGCRGDKRRVSLLGGHALPWRAFDLLLERRHLVRLGCRRRQQLHHRAVAAAARAAAVRHAAPRQIVRVTPVRVAQARERAHLPTRE